MRADFAVRRARLDGPRYPQAPRRGRRLRAPCGLLPRARSRIEAALLAVLIAVATAGLAAMVPAPSGASELPPPTGPIEPRVAPIKGEDGIYHQSWFLNSFMDLREDHANARKAGKRLAIIFEQRGCIYCIKMHKDVLSRRYINDYVRKNFDIVQMDLWGSREVTDFDGKTLTEKKLAERWAVLFTPTVVFIKDDLTGLEGKWGRDLEVLRMGLGIGANTFYDVFTWVRHKVYLKDPNFQRFHLKRIREREALATKGGGKRS